MNEDKAKKIKLKVDAAIAEIAAEMMDEETVKEVKSEVEKILRACDIPVHKTSLKAFNEGVRFVAHLYMHHNVQDANILIAGLSKIIVDIETRTKKSVDESLEKPKSETDGSEQ